MKRLYTPLICLLLLPSSALADNGSWRNIQCAPASLLDSQIKFCSDNTQAQLAAQKCAADLNQAWADAAKEIAVLETDPANAQRLDFGRSQEKYDTAAERLKILIDQTKRNADQL